MANLLILDASSSLCSVALSLDGEVLWSTEDQPRRHAQRLLPMVDELLADAGVARQSLDGVAFGQGPGSFTGIRIALSVAHGLSLGLDVPVCGISSLAAVARAALSQDARSTAFVVMDAHMGEVFWGQYQQQGDLILPLSQEQVGAPSVCLEALAELEKQQPANVSVAGDGLQLMDFAHCDLEYATLKPEARTMAPMAAAAWEAGQFSDPEAHPPVYLRQSVAWKKLSEQPSLLKKI